MLFLVLVIGATSTAAEFASRTMGTWLTFEPRRDRVYGSKVLAAGLGTVPVAVGYLALVVLGVSAIFRYHGIDDHISTSEWTQLGWAGVRSIALLSVVAAVGAAAGLLLRHTAAVLGAVLGYAVVLEMMLRAFRPDLEQYLLSRNVLAWVQDGHEWATWDCPPTGGECTETMHQISLAHGATVIGIVAVVVLLASFLVFRRRDVD
jgi:ABC-2 type transport system permease protein